MVYRSKNRFTRFPRIQAYRLPSTASALKTLEPEVSPEVVISNDRIRMAVFDQRALEVTDDMPPQIVPDLHVISTPTMRVGLKLPKVSKREHERLKTSAAWGWLPGRLKAPITGNSKLLRRTAGDR